MFNYELFVSLKGKNINVLTDNSGMALPGKVVDCTDRYLTLSTRWSSKQRIVLGKIMSFWCDDDKSED